MNSETIVRQLLAGGADRVTCRPSTHRTSAAIEEVDVDSRDGTSLALILKDTSRAGMHEPARRVKPLAVHEPRREIEIYRRILGRHAPGTAAYHGSVVDEEADGGWLLIERVKGMALWQSGHLPDWQAAARWLAGAHTAFTRAGIARQADQVHALRCDGRYYRRWMTRARRLLQEATGDRARKLAWLADKHESVISRLLSLPTTFIHGEFYPGNVLIQHTPGAPRVCPIDWEMAAVAPALMDVAALTTGWAEPEQTAIADAYRDELTRLDAPWPDASGFVEALGWCRIQVAVQWLGWFGTERPPAAHRRNWLDDAVALTACYVG